MALRRTPLPADAHRKVSTAGFTLIEVLVALTIMSTLAVMAWRGVDGIVRSRDISNAQLQRSLLLNTVLAQWEQDLASLQETPVVPTLSFDGGSLRMIRRAPGGLQVVVWSLRSSTVLATPLDGEPLQGLVWQRWAGPAVTLRNALQESWLLSQQLQGNEPGHVNVLDGLTQWQIYYFRGNAWTNAQSSGDRAPGTSFVPLQVELPTGIRMVLEMAPGQLRQGSLTRDIVLGPQP